MVSKKSAKFTHVAAQQRISAESSTLAIVVCVKDNKDVFDRDHEEERPNYD